MPREAPAGDDSPGEKMTTRTDAPPSLPGDQGSKPPPPLPHTKHSQAGPRPFTPGTWEDPVRIIRTILDLYETHPEEAAEVARFAQEKLVKVRAGR